MTDEELAKLLSSYRAPEPPQELEAMVLAKIAREGSVREVPEILPSPWPALAYAAALSVFLAMATGYYMGLRQCRGLLLNDLPGSASSWGG